MGGVPPRLMVCRCSPRSSVGGQVGVVRWVDRGSAPAGLAGQEEPRGLSLPGLGRWLRIAAQAAVVNSSAVCQARCSSPRHPTAATRSS